jgi:FkbM family methyltransferase
MDKKRKTKNILKSMNKYKKNIKRKYKKARLSILGPPKRFTYEGMEIEADGNDRWIKDLYLERYKSSSDKEDFKIYSDYVCEGDTVVDIGAFMGYHALKLSREVADEGVIYAFEPQKKCFVQMKKMKNNMNIKNCKIFNLLVGGENRTILMKTRKEVDPTTNAVEENPWNHDYEHTKKEVVRLDSFCSKKNIEEVDFVKIDVQGMEPQVIEGMSGIINRTEKIYLEVHSKYMKKPKKSVNQIFDVLNEIGNIYEVKKNKLSKVNEPEDIIYEKYHPSIIWFKK